jgi:hypothetical protein
VAASAPVLAHQAVALVLVVRLEAAVASVVVVEGVALVAVEGVVCHQRTSCLP